MRNLMRLTAVALCGLIIASALVRGHFTHMVNEAAVLARMLPDDTFGPKTGFPARYESPGHIAFNTFDIVPSVRGYAGPIKAMVALDRDGIISALEIIEHSETENFVHRMLSPEYLSQFTGKSISDPLEPDKDIDAISRATVSVDALAKTVRLSSRVVGAQVLGLEVKGQPAGGPVFACFGFLSLVVLFAWALWACSSKEVFWAWKGRDMVLLASVLVVGVWLSSPFSALHAYNAMLGRLAWDLRLAALWLGVLVGAVVFGRHYCGWLCPFGAISEFIGRAGTAKWDISPALDARLRRIKYYLLLVVSAVVLLSGNPGYGNFEPYLTLFSAHGTWFAWGILVLALALNLWSPRFWCRYICPVAALTGIVSRRLKGYISAPACPMGNTPHAPVDDGHEGSHASECIRCNRCLSRR